MELPRKKFKPDQVVLDDDWNDDDIIQFVEDSVPIYSQMCIGESKPYSQAVSCQPILHHKDIRNSQTTTISLSFKKPPAVNTYNSRSGSDAFLSLRRDAPQAVNPAQYSYDAAAKDIFHSIEDPLKNESKSTVNTQSEDIRCLSDTMNESHILKKQVEDLTRKQLAHEGEIKWLRNTLAEKDKQLVEVKTMLHQESQKATQQSAEREKLLHKDIEKLRCELQFKEGELMSTSQSLTALLKKTKPSAAHVMGQGFPTRHSFHRNATRSDSTHSDASTCTEIEAVASTSAQAPSVSTGGGRGARCSMFVSNIHKINPHCIRFQDFLQQVLLADLIDINIDEHLRNYSLIDLAGQYKKIVQELVRCGADHAALLLPVLHRVLNQTNRTMGLDLHLSFTRCLSVILVHCRAARDFIVNHESSPSSIIHMACNHTDPAIIAKDLLEFIITSSMLDIIPDTEKNEKDRTVVHRIIDQSMGCAVALLQHGLDICKISDITAWLRAMCKALRVCQGPPYTTLSALSLICASKYKLKCLEDQCLVAGLTSLLVGSDYSRELRAKVLLVISRMCTAQVELFKSMCSHVVQMVTAMITLLYTYTMNYQTLVDSGDQQSAARLLPCLMMGVQILRLLDHLDGDFAEHCLTVLAEFGFVTIKLPVIFKNSSISGAYEEMVTYFANVVENQQREDKPSKIKAEHMDTS